MSDKAIAQPKITQISAFPMPTPMGQIGIMTIGLGDDNQIYQWDNKNKKWVQI